MSPLYSLLFACLVALTVAHGKSGVHVGHFPAEYPENSKHHQPHHPKKPATPEPKKPETPEPKKPATPEPKKPATPEPKKPKPQCSPSEWEGKAIGRLVLEGKPVTAVMFKSKIAISHKCQMEVYETTTKVSPKKYIKTKTYRDFNKRIEYELDVETGKCKISKKIPVPMRRVCSDANDVKYVRSFLVGDKMADMIETTNYGFIGKSVTTVLQESNLPVSSISTIHAEDGSKQYMAVQYANVKAGCQDKSVFVLPAACKACHGHGKKDVHG